MYILFKIIIRKQSVNPVKLCFEIGNGESRAIGILKERFALGEIDKDEFDSKRKDLLG
jgi:uncharacterized membrane protein